MSICIQIFYRRYAELKHIILPYILHYTVLIGTVGTLGVQDELKEENRRIIISKFKFINMHIRAQTLTIVFSQWHNLPI